MTRIHVIIKDVYNNKLVAENYEACIESEKTNKKFFLCRQGETCSNGNPCQTSINTDNIDPVFGDWAYNWVMYENANYADLDMHALYGFCKIPDGIEREEYKKQFNKLNNIVET